MQTEDRGVRLREREREDFYFFFKVATSVQFSSPNQLVRVSIECTRHGQKGEEEEEIHWPFCRWNAISQSDAKYRRTNERKEKTERESERASDDEQHDEGENESTARLHHQWKSVFFFALRFGGRSKRRRRRRRRRRNTLSTVCGHDHIPQQSDSVWWIASTAEIRSHPLPIYLFATITTVARRITIDTTHTHTLMTLMTLMHCCQWRGRIFNWQPPTCIGVSRLSRTDRHRRRHYGGKASSANSTQLSLRLLSSISPSPPPPPPPPP